ncbi:hypothetical protein P4S70_01800 [Enterovibrio sp. Hal110]
MASIQIALDSPYITKAEYLRRSGLTSSTFDRQKAAGDIIILPKHGPKGSVMVNMVAMAKKAAEQPV